MDSSPHLLSRWAPALHSLIAGDTLRQLVHHDFGLQVVGDVRLIQSGLNDHYALHSPHGDFVIRVYRCGWRSNEAITWELDLVDHLFSCGAPVAACLRRRDGEWFSQIQAIEGTRQVALFRYAPGQYTHFGATGVHRISPADCAEQFGRSVAEVHAAADRYVAKASRFALDLTHLLDQPLHAIGRAYAHRRAFNVLDGIANGQILTDHPLHPTWAAVREAGFGTLYLGGSIIAPLLAEIADHFRQFGDVGIGCWLDDPLLAMMPAKPDYDGRTLYFTERSQHIRLEDYVEQIPPDCELRPRERSLIAQSPDYELALAAFGNVENIFAHTLGFLLIRENVLLCEAATGAPAHNWIEIGVSTPEQHRRHGYATITCAQLIAVCEAQGLRTWWDCAKQNQASLALARKLGYQGEREYRFVLWSKR